VTGTRRPICVGDCRHNGDVTVNDLISGVRIALGEQPLGGCSPFDANGDDRVDISELVLGVRNALHGCP